MDNECLVDHCNMDNLDCGCPCCGNKEIQIDYCWWFYHNFLSVEAFYNETLNSRKEQHHGRRVFYR